MHHMIWKFSREIAETEKFLPVTSYRRGFTNKITCIMYFLLFIVTAENIQ